MSDFQTQTTVKAAKQHACCECRSLITVGQQHAKNSGVFDGAAFSYRTCLPCAEVRDWLDAKLRAVDYLNSDEGIEFGALRAELAEYASESRFADVESLRHLLGMAERSQAPTSAPPSSPRQT